MWEAILVEEVEQWYQSLDTELSEAVTAAIDYPHHMKELRPAGTSIRVLFIFDPQRNAVLLVSGDKSGQWKKWYTDNIPIAEERYKTWLDENGGE